MKSQKNPQTFTPYDVKEMAKQLVNLLQKRFRQTDDQSVASGLFPIVGRGDGSLNDSYRLAEPSDNLLDYHLPLNALQPKTGPFYVHTRANLYERKGVLIPHLTGCHQPGSDQALYEREEMTVLLTELLLQTAILLGHKPGLIVPFGDKRAHIVRPQSAMSQVFKSLQTAKRRQSIDIFSNCLQSAQKMSHKLEFAIIISDFLSDNWQKEIINLGRRLEIVAFQIVDPWDLALPNLGRVKIKAPSKEVWINTKKAATRFSYQEEAQAQQTEITQALQQAKAQHFVLSTTKPLLPQLSEVFNQPRLKQKQTVA